MKEQHNLGIQRYSQGTICTRNCTKSSGDDSKGEKFCLPLKLQMKKTEYSCDFLRSEDLRDTSYLLEKSNFVGALWRWEHFSSELSVGFPLQLAFLSIWLLSLLPENSSEIWFSNINTGKVRRGVDSGVFLILIFGCFSETMARVIK